MFTIPESFVTLTKTAKRSSILFAFLTALIPSVGGAQDQGNFAQFYLNPYLLNPSYAGLDGQPSASLVYRKQWMTIDGAPTITNLSLQAPLNTRVGAGVNINNDSKGFYNNSTLLFSVAYHVPVQEHSFVRFGLSAGGSWNTVDMKKLEAVNDPALSNVLEKNASLAGNAGISFHHRTFNFGISLPAIFSPAYVSEDAFNVKEVKPFQALVVHATNRFYFNDNKNIFEPYLLYHINTGLPKQFEFAGIVHVNHLVWVGGSYKQFYGISGLGGIKLKNALALGASYSIAQSGVDELNSPSFEVSVNYLFGDKKRNAPVYSFVNAVKPKEKAQNGPARQVLTARQKQVEAERQRREEAARVNAEKVAERQRLAAEADAKKKQAQADLVAKNKASQEAAEAKKRQALADREAKVTLERQAEEARKNAADEKIRQAQNEKQQGETQALKDTASATKIETPVEQPEVIEEEPERNQFADKVQSGGQQPVAVPQNIPEGDPQRDQQQLQTLQANAQDPDRIVAETTSTPVRHETFKRGDHPQELPAAEYVVVGVFKSLDNAEHFSNGLRSLDYKTQHGHLTPTDLWYVYIMKTNNAQRAQAEQKRLSKLFLLRDAWLLTVEL